MASSLRIKHNDAQCCMWVYTKYWENPFPSPIPQSHSPSAAGCSLWLFLAGLLQNIGAMVRAQQIQPPELSCWEGQWRGSIIVPPLTSQTGNKAIVWNVSYKSGTPTHIVFSPETKSLNDSSKPIQVLTVELLSQDSISADLHLKSWCISFLSCCNKWPQLGS